MPVIEEEDEENDDSTVKKTLDDEDEPGLHPDELPAEDPHSDSEEVSDADSNKDEDTQRLHKSLAATVENPALSKNTMATLYQNVSRFLILEK